MPLLCSVKLRQRVNAPVVFGEAQAAGKRPCCVRANDTQVYILLSQTNAQEFGSIDILFRMESSKLKLNPDKTDLIIIGTKQQRNMAISHFPVKLPGND